jgi:hypothetical protein
VASRLLLAEGELIGRPKRARACRCGHRDIDGAISLGETAVIDVAELTVDLAALVEPNWNGPDPAAR